MVERLMRASSQHDTILDAAETLMSEHGFNGVSMRSICQAAGVNLGSVTYHFGTKAGLLRAIYQRHVTPMNARRTELLREAERLFDRAERVEAIIRAFLVPAFSSNSDDYGGGARFTRVRAILSMEGNETARQIIAEALDETSQLFVDALSRAIPDLDKDSIVWRCHFLLGGLYYTLVNGERIDRLTEGRQSGADHEKAIDELARSTAAGLLGSRRGA